MTGYYVYYGEGKYPFELPSGWTVLPSAVSEEVEAALSVPEMVEQALAAPISAPRLADVVHEGSNVALLVDDGARPTPVRHILPPLLRELRLGGARREQVDIVVALGTHRPLPPAALADRLGEDVCRQYRVSQHDCHAENLVPVGRLFIGGAVRINPTVARADVRIGVGSILPHPFNGFGGGAKIVMPGVADHESVKEHHLRLIPRPGSTIGNLETNPAYRESCRVAEQVGLDFIVNCVYNAREEVVGVVAGHFREAHRAGVEASRENYAVRLGEPADVTITSAYPYTGGPQMVKPLIPACLATRPGGAVIMAAASREGVPEPMLAALDTIYARHAQRAGRFAVDSFDACRLLVEGSIEFNCAVYYALVCAARNPITLVSGDLDERSVTRMGFRYVRSLEEAIARESRVRPRATVNVFPIGGLVLPFSTPTHLAARCFQNSLEIIQRPRRTSATPDGLHV